MISFHWLMKVIELDQRNREIKQEVEALRADKNQISKQIGCMYGTGKERRSRRVKEKSSGKCRTSRGFI